MNQKRMIHTSLWASGQIAKLSRDARLLYVGTISLGDDDGRLKGVPSLLRSQIYPYDDDVKVVDVAKWLQELLAQGLVVEYEDDGQKYLFHPKWETYQHIREDRRRESNIPAPMLEFLPMSTKRQPNGNQSVDKSPRSIGKTSIVKGRTDTLTKDVAFQVLWDAYPLKVGKKAAWKAWQRVDVTQELAARIMASLEQWRASDQWTKDAGRYIPHASTWINGERWEDEVKAEPSKKSKYANSTSKTVRA